MYQRPRTKTTLSSKALNENGRPNKDLRRQKKSERLCLHQTSSVRDAKGSVLRRGKKGHKKRPRRSLHNAQGKNPSGRHKHCNHIYTQHRNTQIYKQNFRGLQEKIDSNVVYITTILLSI